MRASPAACALALACVLAGCGAEAAKRPPTTVKPGTPLVRFHYSRVGLAVSIPRVAGIQKRPAPGVFRSILGEASVAAFAYRRREQLPRIAAELQAARKRLVGEVRRRGQGFRLIGSRATRVAGARAIEVLGDQTLSHVRYRTRSVHVFKGRAEYVLDMLAPVGSFTSTNKAFFSPVARSLRVSGRIRP